MYMSNRLTIANIRNEPEMITEVIGLLADLKGAWEAIEKTQQVGNGAPLAYSQSI